MPDAEAAREESVSSETQLKSLLPQIRVAVSWACHRYHYFPDQSVIEDFAQEIALSLIEKEAHNLRSFKHRSKEKTWLQVVALHRVARYFKSQKPTESLKDLPADSQPLQPPSQEDEVLLKEVEKLVEKAQDELTERERELWDFLCDGLDDKEIAELMKIEIRTVQRFRSVLRKKIRDIVKCMIGEQ